MPATDSFHCFDFNVVDKEKTLALGLAEVLQVQRYIFLIKNQNN